MAPARDNHLLLPLLGPRRIGHVRVVVIHLAVSPARPDTPLTGAARALVGLLSNRLPAGTGITVLNVMVPSSETGQLPRGMLLELPTIPVVNIAVSPEDRRSDAHADIAVRNGAHGNFTGHAVLGCVTVAGLWRGVDTGPLDTSSLSSAFDEDVVVARTFASLVWSGTVVDEVGAQVLAPRASWPHPQRPTAGPLDPAAIDQVAARCRGPGRRRVAVAAGGPAGAPRPPSGRGAPPAAGAGRLPRHPVVASPGRPARLCHPRRPRAGHPAGPGRYRPGHGRGGARSRGLRHPR